jgi:glycosyltransferase involved in cell wall biosynthesis
VTAPRISIAMATYNGARFIEEQLDSIAAQTLLPAELVVTDDGSTDGTVGILERFASRAPFGIRVERNPARLGFNRNFERALSLCDGDLVLISDQDDIWYPQKIARVTAAMAAEPEKLALIHDEHIRDPGGRTLDVTYLGNVRRLGFTDRELLSGNCTAVRKALLDMLLPFPDGINYDYWIGWMADILGARIVLDEPLQLYRRHELNSSSPVLAEDAPTHWSIFLRSGLSDPRLEWASNMLGLKLVAERIASHDEALDALLGVGRASAAIDRAGAEIAGLQHRVRLANMPKWRRWPAVLQSWRTGFYSGFSGTKSAVKDMIRP